MRVKRKVAASGQALARPSICSPANQGEQNTENGESHTWLDGTGKTQFEVLCTIVLTAPTEAEATVLLCRGFYALMIIVPISLIIMFSFVIFILPVTQIKGRMNIMATLFLTLIGALTCLQTFITFSCSAAVCGCMHSIAACWSRLAGKQCCRVEAS